MLLHITRERLSIETRLPTTKLVTTMLGGAAVISGLMCVELVGDNPSPATILLGILSGSLGLGADAYWTARVNEMPAELLDRPVVHPRYKHIGKA